jgi:hypothetical protein
VTLVEPEFVAHLFVSVERPEDARTLWDNCRRRLGLTQPIVKAGLVADLPADLADQPDGAVAGAQDPAVQFQGIVRREHDILNVSIVARTGWFEFQFGGDPLGSAVLYLAKTESPIDPRAEVPAQDGDADGWWNTGFTLRGFAAWEVTPAGPYASRRLVLLGRPDEDAELSRLAWSDGGAELPPLARYLMHAAKLRYQARVRGDGRDLSRLRERIAGHLREPGRATELAADRAALAETLQALRQMRRSVEIARANMARALGEPLPADAEFAVWLTDQLADDTEYLEASWEHLERSEKGRHPQPDGELQHRVGFGIDVVSYSSRSTPRQHEVQSRLAGMVERVLADLHVTVHETDRQPAGDGLMCVLPGRVPAHMALWKLLRGWRAQVVTDNARHPDDRIRLRLSVGSGPFTPAAVGFSGQTIIGIGRLLDSEPLRRAVVEHPDADLVAIVTDRTYQDVVGEQYPGLSAGEFTEVAAAVKTYTAKAWLWTGGGQGV